MDTYQNVYGHRDINSSAVTTGKSISHMGIKGRTESTGLGFITAQNKSYQLPAKPRN